MKILVVRFKQIGDSILTGPLCYSLKKSFPDAQVDYVVYDHIAPLFEKNKYIDNVISITKEERKNIFKYIKKVWRVTRNNYDIVIDVMSTPKSELFTLFSRKSKYRIGREKKHRGYTYTHKIPEPKDAKNKVDKFLKMLKPLEKEYKMKYTEDFSIEIPEEEKLYMRKKMEDAGIDFKRPVFAVAINSRVAGKVYDINRMMEVIKNIIKYLDPQIVFYYSPNEKEFAKKTHEALNWDKHIFSNIETKSIRELGMLLSNCTLFFGNEGGPRHLSQSVGIPTFTIYRAGFDIKEWAFQGEKHDGVGPLDADVNAYSLPADKQNDLITPELVIKKFKAFYRKLIENKEAK